MPEIESPAYQITADRAAALIEAWGEMDGAAQRMLVALPAQMTAAAEALDTARLSMRAAIQRWAVQ